MSVYLLAASVLLASTAPLILLAVRAPVPRGLVALELSTTIVTLVLLLVAQGTNRQPFFDLALVSAVLSFAGSLTFARFLERWV
jgi:multicomponent Na+:H+ antiporter subunit F